MDTLARGSRHCPKRPPAGRNASRAFLRPAGVCLAAGLLAAVICLPASAQKHKDLENIGTRDINKGSINFYSVEKEIVLGLRVSRQIEMTTVLLRDREVQRYVNDLVQRLVRHSDAYLPFTVKIVDSDEINAFALPGGFLYVNTGLILQARTEAELAGMLAHEIAHVTARHYTKRRSKANLLRLLTVPLIVLGGPAGVAIQQGLGITGPLALLKFARNDEKQADMLGLQYSYRSGYDPAALVDILERLGNDEHERQVAKIFSTHPMNKDRIKRAQIQIETILPERDEYVVSTAAFDRIRKRIARRYHNRHLYDPGEADGPRMRRRTQEETP